MHVCVCVWLKQEEHLTCETWEWNSCSPCLQRKDSELVGSVQCNLQSEQKKVWFWMELPQTTGWKTLEPFLLMTDELLDCFTASLCIPCSDILHYSSTLLSFWGNTHSEGTRACFLFPWRAALWTPSLTNLWWRGGRCQMCRWRGRWSPFCNISGRGRAHFRWRRRPSRRRNDPERCCSEPSTDTQWGKVEMEEGEGALYCFTHSVADSTKIKTLH